MTKRDNVLGALRGTTHLTCFMGHRCVIYYGSFIHAHEFDYSRDIVDCRLVPRVIGGVEIDADDILTFEVYDDDE